jgi:iron complex outermembrane recepter protein
MSSLANTASCLALTAAISLAPQAFADEPQPSDGASGEIVVTASVIRTPDGEILQGVAVIDQAEILAAPAGGLGATLDAQPGIASTQFGSGASRPIIRGLGEDRIRILSNGLGQVDVSATSPDHAVPTEAIEADKVEVLRGPSALAFGGNAIGGVVNVLDQRIASRRPEGGTDGALLWSRSSVDEGWQIAGNAQVALPGGLVVSVSGQNRTAEPYRIPGTARSAAAIAADPLPPGDEVRDRAPNQFLDTRSYAGGISYVQDWGFAGVAAKRFTTEYGLLPEEAGEAGGRIELEQTRYEGRGAVRLSSGMFDDLSFGLAVADYTHSELEADGEVGTRFTNEGYEGRIELRQRAAFRGRLNGAIGLSGFAIDVEADGDEAFLPPTETRDIGAFGVQRWDAGGYGFEGGVRVERRTVETPGTERDFTPVSASVGAFARPYEGVFIGVNVSRNERAPTDVELFADGPHLATASFEIGDATLDKETSLSIEGTARWNGERASLEANIWRTSFSDYIALIPDGTIEDDLPVFIYEAEDATFTGGEITARYAVIPAGNGLSLSVDAGLDIVRAEFDDGGDVPRIPPLTLTLGADASIGTVDGRIELVRAEDQDRPAFFETQTEGYSLLNARFAWTPLRDRGEALSGLTFAVDGRNLTDEEARLSTSFLKDELPLPGRDVRVSLSLTF